MSNYLIIIVYLFIVVLVVSCSDDNNNETQISHETYMGKLMCEDNHLLKCWKVSKEDCEKGFEIAINHCKTIESKFVLEARKIGREVIDPVCITDNFITTLEIDDDTAQKCDEEINYSNEEIREKMDNFLNN